MAGNNVAARCSWSHGVRTAACRLRTMRKDRIAGQSRRELTWRRHDQRAGHPRPRTRRGPALRRAGRFISPLRGIVSTCLVLTLPAGRASAPAWSAVPLSSGRTGRPNVPTPQNDGRLRRSHRESKRLLPRHDAPERGQPERPPNSLNARGNLGTRLAPGASVGAVLPWYRLRSLASASRQYAYQYGPWNSPSRHRTQFCLPHRLIS